MCSFLSRALNQGPGPQPRHVPWLGIEPPTLWFVGWHSIPWATLARARKLCFEANTFDLEEVFLCHFIIKCYIDGFQMLEIPSRCILVVLVIWSTLSFYFVNVLPFSKQLTRKAKPQRRVNGPLSPQASSLPWNRSVSSAEKTCCLRHLKDHFVRPVSLCTHSECSSLHPNQARLREQWGHSLAEWSGFCVSNGDIQRDVWDTG